MNPWLWRAMSWTFAWKDQIRSWNQNSMYLPIPTPHHTVPDQKPTRSPEAEVSTSASTDVEIGVSDRRVRFREERHHVDVSSDRELTEERVEKCRESVVPFHSSEASSSEPQQTSTAAASDNPTGELLYMSMTEKGPSPIKGERTMNIQKAREERRNFYVGGSQEHGTFSIASAEASTLHG